MKRKIAVVLALCLLITVSLANSNSYAAGGSWKSNSNGWWYEYSDGSYASGWTEIDGYWYFFTGSGYMDYSEYRDGCWLNADGTWNTAYSGGCWASDSTGWWYTDASGWYPVNTWLWIDGSCYYFKASGYLAVNEWIDGYFVDASGEITTDPSHTHSWIYLVDQAAYDEPIYEEQPVYETHFEHHDRFVWRWDNGWVAYDEATQYSLIDRYCQEYGVVYNAACTHYNGDWECTADCKEVKTQTGTQKVQTGTKHHDEVGHYECSCGATKY